MAKVGAKKGVKKTSWWQRTPPKYNKDIHPDLLIDLYRVGQGCENFCDQADIHETTFFEWVKMHPEFAESYKVARSKRKAYFTKAGLHGMHMGKDFNTGVWSIFMRNVNDMPDYRRVQIDFASCATPDDKLKLIDEKVSAGELTSAEARHMAEYVASCAKIHEATRLQLTVQELADAAGIAY